MAEQERKRDAISALQLCRLALSNVLRNKRKNMVIVFMLAIGVASFLTMDSLLVGLTEQGTRNVITYETGSYQILQQGYWNNPDTPLAGTFRLPDETVEALSGQWHVSPRVRFTAEMIFKSPPYQMSGSLFHSVVGVDTVEDVIVQDFGRSLVEGSATLNMDGAWVSEWLADQLAGAAIGDPLILVTRGKGGFVEQIELMIQGIYHTPNAKVDRSTVFIDYRVADEMLALDGTYNEVNVYRKGIASGTAVEDSDDILLEQGRKALVGILRQQSSNRDLVVASWKDVQRKRGTFSNWNYSRALSGLYMVFIFIIAATGLINVISINLNARRKEIGTLYAFGMSTKEGFLLFLLEYTCLGILGALLGLMMGMVPVWYLTIYGADYSFAFKETTFGLPVDTVIFGVWRFDSFVYAFLLGVVFTTLISAVVLLRTNKRYNQITDLLRVYT